MKHLVSLTALIALLGCGSDSDIITPDPSINMVQPAKKLEPPVEEEPLVELPDVIVQILNQDPPIPPLDPNVIAEILEKDPPEPPELEPPEVPEVIIAEVLENPPKIRVLKPPEVPEIIIEIQQNDDPPMIIRINPPEAMPEPPNGDPPPDE
ncbi:MAG: hypothetical protein OXU27_08670 [Candidatus Poribacteria bacterium]|nr:hypothetical protein [Candidatus Poribacteria bacterium]MDE0326881.1 hypothetical protein [Candidatus Poribacteria bacterium]